MHEFHRTFLSEVEQFITASGMKPTVFGQKAINDPRFVFQIRKGREPRFDTVEKVRAWMAAQVGEKAA